MRTRSFVFASLALIGSAYAFGAVGCSATNTSTDDSDSGAHTGKTDGGDVVGDDDADGGGGDDDGSVQDSGGGDDSSTITDSSVVTRKDATVAQSDGGVCPAVVPTATDLDNAGGWNPPNARTTTACTAGDITQLQTNGGTAQTFADLKTGVSANCLACAFSLETDAHWGTIVTDATGATGFFNYGACYAAASGAASCGKAVEYDEWCYDVSCGACADDTSFNTCANGVDPTCQANFVPAIQSQCTGDAAALDATCGSVLDEIQYLCGPAQ